MSSIPSNTKSLTPQDRQHLTTWENHHDDGSELIGLDGGFTYISIVERLPKILQSMMDSNREDENLLKSEQGLKMIEKLNELKHELEKGDVCTKFRIGTCSSSLLLYDEENCRDLKEWKEYEEKFGVSVKTWLEMSWFFVENYFYRLILDITDYWKKGSPFYQWDPFARQKQKSLDIVFAKNKETQQSVADQFSQLLNELPSHDDLTKQMDLMREVIVLSLWGNQADLSLSTGLHCSEESFKKVLEENIISNDLSQVMKVLHRLKTNGKQSIAIILDNCGLELVSDLYLADTLIRLGFCESVTFFSKYQPVFVSDVTERDFRMTIQQLQEKDSLVQVFGDRFSKYLNETKQWKLMSHPFFTSPLQYTHIPEDLALELKQHDFIFMKGDANYRRTLNDAKLPLQQDFNETLQYFPYKNGLCCLRTIKSYSLIGIKDFEKLATISEQHSNWRYSGDFGVVQVSLREQQ
ncbi:hypothetical protein C9374_005005 [Naegleria lovaniensis]|uniref:Sugar phosphate phosphatase n=1 Tax=Naegleria lovaniensis TaxID=51637 RepID=A0AA88GRW5_NAELO|nr:uncharacterized protein C9374_005005 [Naegleria lovaniensis]KAG2383038.1 hypothetical protein C9374_005005 [Naegleria lovaniensis]